MRLTLRTLLAYLDDTLDAAESREIGARLAENESAQELAERVRKLVRSRNVGAPIAGTSIFGPNVVASYLCDAMASEKVAEFERTCLESDLHLAELAACHQILSLVLSEQVRVPPTARRRMYQLVKGKESIPYREPKKDSLAIGGILREERLSEFEILPEKPANDEPEQSPISRVLIGLVAGLALSVVFLFTAYLAIPNATVSEEIDHPKSLNYAQTHKPEEPKKEQPKVEEPKKEEPKVEEPKKEEPKKEEPKKEEPKKEEPKKEEPKKEEPKKEEPKKEGPLAPASVEKRVIGKMERNSGILVRKKAPGEPWTRVMLDDPNLLGAIPVMSLPGFRSTITLDTGLTIDLWGNVPELLPVSVYESSVLLAVPAEGFDSDLELRNGRIYLSTKKTEGAKVRLRVQSEVWDVELADSKTEIVVEMIRVATPGNPSGETRVSVGLTYLNGRGAITTRKKEIPTHTALTKGDEVYWSSHVDLVEIKHAMPGAKESPYLSKFTAYPNAQVAQTALTCLNDCNRKMSDSTRVRAVFDEAIQNVTDSSNMQTILSARFAIFSLSALGDHKGLASALHEPNNALIRRTAVEGIRNLLASHPESAEEFTKDLVTSYRLTDAEAGTLIALAKGPNDRDRKDGSIIAKSIESLSSNDIAVRELSFANLMGFIDPKDPANAALITFDAGGRIEDRDRVVQAWKRRAEEIRKKLVEPPVPQAPAPKAK